MRTIDCKNHLLGIDLKNKEIKIIAKNRRAFYEYEIIDTLEAGISLTGTEVKSLRQNNLSFADAWVQIKNKEAFLIGMHIPPYEQGNRFNVDPVRDRKLLLHKAEIRKLETSILQKGFTLVPTKIYFRQGLVKVEVALARGKKIYDKRRSRQDEEVKRAMAAKLKEQMKGNY